MLFSDSQKMAFNVQEKAQILSEIHRRRSIHLHSAGCAKLWKKISFLSWWYMKMEAIILGERKFHAQKRLRETKNWSSYRRKSERYVPKWSKTKYSEGIEDARRIDSNGISRLKSYSFLVFLKTPKPSSFARRWQENASWTCEAL